RGLGALLLDLRLLEDGVGVPGRLRRASHGRRGARRLERGAQRVEQLARADDLLELLDARILELADRLRLREQLAELRRRREHVLQAEVLQRADLQRDRARVAAA